MKGNIDQCFIAIADPSPVFRQRMSNSAIAMAEFYQPVDCYQGSKKTGEIDNLRLYYLGEKPDDFCKIFDHVADTRVSFSIFQKQNKVANIADSKVVWQESTNGFTANCQGIRMQVCKTLDGTWYGLCNDKRIVEGLDDAVTAQNKCKKFAEQMLTTSSSVA